QTAAQIPRQGGGAISACAKRAVELGSTDIGAQSRSPDVIHCDTIKLVPGATCVSRPATLAEVRVESNVPNWFDTSSKAHTLKQVLVQKTGGDQSRTERGHIAKIVVVDVERNSLVRLNPESEKVPAEACARSLKARQR